MTRRVFTGQCSKVMAAGGAGRYRQIRRADEEEAKQEQPHPLSEPNREHSRIERFRRKYGETYPYKGRR
ncbi:MAG: hypothetical protein KJ718_05380 [Nanoarchaeota archaeon]|nr:hypothetical protein [Nanoarchaeota archaeon]MBU1051954.1 hypothetical protein [Nanoarchaeota archaeon]MBU1988294.1 hypothetical protein [Nanoarchaeota archaeon]